MTGHLLCAKNRVTLAGGARDDDQMPSLVDALAALPAETRALLERFAFDDAAAARFAASLSGDDGPARRRARNEVAGPVVAPKTEEIPEAPTAGTPEHDRLKALGEAAIARGELAFCVMAGGMATRMGGVVKALVDALPGHTFLDVRLAETAALAGNVPLWLMTSEATDAPLQAAIAAHAGRDVATFTQSIGVRFTQEGELFRGDDGAPSTYGTGHGDLVDGLLRSGLLHRFVAGGGKYVWIANIDNLGASVDPALFGAFVESEAAVQVEVCPKVTGDKGGIPVHAEGKLQVLEEFRLPSDFDPTTVRVFNTNTFLVRADALLGLVGRPWSYFEVEKKVDGRVAIQFERLLQELTAWLPSRYVRIPRDGAESRFVPVKDHDELARRQEEIRAVLGRRGLP
jgi:UTP--glucose-1-phosphate uridylyltransferase